MAQYSLNAKTLRNIVSSAAEAETCGIFHNAQTAVPIRQILSDLHHPQPHKPIKTDSTTVLGFTYNNIQLKRSKYWDMKLNWLRDRQHQELFDFSWEKGNSEDTFNEADYFTEHHLAIYHRHIRGRYVHDDISIFT